MSTADRRCSVVGWALLGIAAWLPATADGAPLKPDLRTLDPTPLRMCEELPDTLFGSQVRTGTGGPFSASMATSPTAAPDRSSTRR